MNQNTPLQENIHPPRSNLGRRRGYGVGCGGVYEVIITYYIMLAYGVGCGGVYEVFITYYIMLAIERYNLFDIGMVSTVRGSIASKVTKPLQLRQSKNIMPRIEKVGFEVMQNSQDIYEVFKKSQLFCGETKKLNKKVKNETTAARPPAPAPPRPPPTNKRIKLWPRCVLSGAHIFDSASYAPR